MDDFKEYIDTLKQIFPVVICGDYNICHQAIDIHDPLEIKMSGFTTRTRMARAFLQSGLRTLFVI